MSDMRTGRIAIAGFAVFAIAFAIVFLVITGYAVKLGFEARGQPDPEAIQMFAERVTPWLGPLVSIVLTLIAGFWVATKASAQKTLHGTLVGGVVGVLALAMSIVSGFSASDLLPIALPVAAGWLGGIAAARRRG